MSKTIREWKHFWITGLAAAGLIIILANARPVLADHVQAGQAFASWDSFWKDFSAAVHKQDRNALRATMAERFEFGEVGAGFETPRDAFTNWDRYNAWKALAHAIERGAADASPPKGWALKDRVKIAPPEAADCNSADWFAIFEQTENGRWRFVSFIDGVGD